MKQIMVITNPHPVLIQDVMTSLYSLFLGHEDVLILSAQAVSMILEEAKGIKYDLSFEQTIRVTENSLDAIIMEKKIRYLVVVGTLEKKEMQRFDAILGYNELADDGLPVYAEWPIKHTMDVMTLEDADGVINNEKELHRFLYKLYQMLKGDKK